jgi:hypothetical protein
MWLLEAHSVWAGGDDVDLLNRAMEKYHLPVWVTPYAKEYIRARPLNAIKYATSFVEFGRRKGSVTKDAVVLPNGLSLNKEYVIQLLGLFYYGEERSSAMSREWSAHAMPPNGIYSEHFRRMGEQEAKRARAIKNMIEGLGGRICEPSAAVTEVFDYVSAMESWEDRFLSKMLILNYAFSKTCGLLFYRIFYAVSPEFMRSFGKALKSTYSESEWGEKEAERMVVSGEVDRNRLVGLSEDILSRVSATIDAEIPMAKKSKLEPEAKLLKNVAITFPLEKLRELNVDIDVRSELKRIENGVMQQSNGSPRQRTA